jgi:transcriptional regulator with XRE-family HTH domain
MSTTSISSFGDLLRRWRETRRISQLDLALEAEVSARHISFIETGRAVPSREMVMTLAGVLDVPLRERNLLLQAAGYAPIYRETSLDDPQMAQVRQALELILKQQQPFGAIVFNRRWDLIMANESYVVMSKMLLEGDHEIIPYTVIKSPKLNLMKLLFDPAGWRPHLVNWEPIAKSSLARLYREASRENDPQIVKLLDEILSFPDVPRKWQKPDFDVPQDLVVPIEMRMGDLTLKLFSTITTLGSPQDITLQELHIEAMHPADETTAELVRTMMQLPG